MKKLILSTALLIGLFNSTTVSADDTFEIGLGVGLCDMSERNGYKLCTNKHVEHLYGKWSFYRSGGVSLSYQLHHFSRLEKADLEGDTPNQTGAFDYQGVYVNWIW